MHSTETCGIFFSLNTWNRKFNNVIYVFDPIPSLVFIVVDQLRIERLEVQQGFLSVLLSTNLIQNLCRSAYSWFGRSSFTALRGGHHFWTNCNDDLCSGGLPFFTTKSEYRLDWLLLFFDTEYHRWIEVSLLFFFYIITTQLNIRDMFLATTALHFHKLPLLWQQFQCDYDFWVDPVHNILWTTIAFKRLWALLWQ